MSAGSGPAALVVEVATPQGPGRFHVSPATDPVAVLVLGHGAGGGVDAPDLAALARHLPDDGVTVLRFEQPWRLAGRRVAVRPPLLDEAWLAALAAVLDGPGTGLGVPRGLPLVTGGRSAGARVACRTADALGVAGVVCLGFPLHLPGRPERSRLPELLDVAAPRLVLQGTRDTFGGAAELRAALQVAHGDPDGDPDGEPDGDPDGAGDGEKGRDEGRGGVRVVDLVGADHSGRVLKAAVPGAAALRDLVVATTSAFVRERGIPL